MNQREAALHYVEKFIGLPYVWGGDHPALGYDCSGLIIEMLQAVGIMGRTEDTSAAGLYTRFKAKQIKEPIPGALAFWRNATGAISHVEVIVMLLGEPITIGASGGGSTTYNKEIAIKQGAFVKMRPIRDGYVALVDPFL